MEKRCDGDGKKERGHVTEEKEEGGEKSVSKLFGQGGSSRPGRDPGVGALPDLCRFLGGSRREKSLERRGG